MSSSCRPPPSFSAAPTSRRRLLDPATRAPAEYVIRARRQLALALAASGRDQDYPEALALIDRNVATRGATAEDERVRAALLASRPGQRLAAVRLFEIALKDGPISEEDQFLLVRLWDAAGIAERAQSLMLDLLATAPNNPQYLAFHVRSLLRRGDPAGTRFYLDQLERVEPRSTRAQELKALLAAKEAS